MSLITDIVRCAVRFETAAEMQSFVTHWILKFGQAHQNALEVRWVTSIQNEIREFFRIFGEHFRNEPISEADDASANNTNSSTRASEDIKLFEICRIRNRLDPDLIDAPGGYRDLAFKLKIGFVRCGDVLFIYRFCIVSFGPSAMGSFFNLHHTALIFALAFTGFPSQALFAFCPLEVGQLQLCPPNSSLLSCSF